MRGISIRPATLADAFKLFEWRNDSETRSASHDEGPIDYDAHLEWMRASLADTRRHLYVVELDQVAVGTIRCDEEEADVTRLSWTVSPDQRRKGIGREMVMSLTRQLDTALRAEIKAGNTGSAKIAEACGMKLQFVKDGVMHYHRDKRHSQDSHADPRVT